MQPVDAVFPFGVLSIPEAERREPTPADFADPRFEVIWQLIKRLDVDFGNGLRSGATGNDVCAILDRLSRASSPSPSAALREQAEKVVAALAVYDAECLRVFGGYVKPSGRAGAEELALLRSIEELRAILNSGSTESP